VAWHSGHRVRLQKRRSQGRIPPGCKVLRSLYIAVLLSLCVFEKNKRFKKLFLIPQWAKILPIWSPCFGFNYFWQTSLRMQIWRRETDCLSKSFFFFEKNFILSFWKAQTRKILLTVHQPAVWSLQLWRGSKVKTEKFDRSCFIKSTQSYDFWICSYGASVVVV
jgi:hypothetical protein